MLNQSKYDASGSMQNLADLRRELECLRQAIARWEEKLDEIVLKLPRRTEPVSKSHLLEGKSGLMEAQLNLGLTLLELKKLHKNLSLWQERFNLLMQNAEILAVPALPQAFPKNESLINVFQSGAKAQEFWRDIECLRLELDNWQSTLQRLIQVTKGLAFPASKPPPPANKGLATTWDTNACKVTAVFRKMAAEHAGPSAEKVDAIDLEGGGLIVSIDGRREFELSRKLGVLLQVLCADTGTYTGPLVGWKKVADIQEALVKRLGGGFTKQVVKQSISLLRMELRKVGEPPDLVQTSRKVGYRFRLLSGGTLSPQKTNTHKL